MARSVVVSSDSHIGVIREINGSSSCSVPHFQSSATTPSSSAALFAFSMRTALIISSVVGGSLEQLCYPVNGKVYPARGNPTRLGEDLRATETKFSDQHFNCKVVSYIFDPSAARRDSVRGILLRTIFELFDIACSRLVQPLTSRALHLSRLSLPILITILNDR